MNVQTQTKAAIPELTAQHSIMSKLPVEVKEWAESLPWKQRRYVLSLCHILCGSPPELQAEFLDDYTADGLVSRILQDHDTVHKVKDYLRDFRLKTELNETVLRSYIRQFYIHSAQDVRRQPERYLESALRLVLSTEEQNNVFNYMLGFELLKMMFKMSWLQQERLSLMQKTQESFIETYIKPIQHAHKINGIVVPKYKTVFFARRDYFVQIPNIPYKKLIELVMATFTTEIVNFFGFSVIRHPQSLRFDYEYIFNPEPESIFCPEVESII